MAQSKDIGIGMVDRDFLKLVYDEPGQWSKEKKEPEKAEVKQAIMKQEEVKQEEVKLDEVKQEKKGLPEEQEFTKIKAGTIIRGNISTSDSLIEIQGEVSGNVECKGSVIVKGKIGGDITALDIHIASEQRLTGNLVSSHSIKIESGVKVVGNVTAGTVYIAGALKGDVCAERNLEISSKAVVYGNIMAKIFQVSTGAIIEGQIVPYQVDSLSDTMQNGSPSE